jgi:hypothetical protein
VSHPWEYSLFNGPTDNLKLVVKELREGGEFIYQDIARCCAEKNAALVLFIIVNIYII